MKTLNIYLTRPEKLAADKVRMKYKVSLSTLTGVIAFITFDLFNKHNPESLAKMQEHYLSREGNYKTSIKPRELNEVLHFIENKSMFASNCLKIYLNRTVKEYLKPDQINLYWARIDKELNQKYDVHWNYNSSIRNFRRMLKQNKNYWKKVIDNL